MKLLNKVVVIPENLFPTNIFNKSSNNTVIQHLPANQRPTLANCPLLTICSAKASEPGDYSALRFNRLRTERDAENKTRTTIKYEQPYCPCEYECPLLFVSPHHREHYNASPKATSAVYFISYPGSSFHLYLLHSPCAVIILLQWF